MDTIKKILKAIINLFPRHKTPAEFYDLCVSSLGTHVGNNNNCSTLIIDHIYNKLTGKNIGGELSTFEMYWFLNSRKRYFKEVVIPEPGDIIISPTGYSMNENDIGNVGVVAYGDQIFSNNNDTGKFDNHIGFQEWFDKYKKQGFPVKFFRLK